jgi:hypothetical protein
MAAVAVTHPQGRARLGRLALERAMTEVARGARRRGGLRLANGEAARRREAGATIARCR